MYTYTETMLFIFLAVVNLEGIEPITLLQIMLMFVYIIVSVLLICLFWAKFYHIWRDKKKAANSQTEPILLSQSETNIMLIFLKIDCHLNCCRKNIQNIIN